MFLLVIYVGNLKHTSDHIFLPKAEIPPIKNRLIVQRTYKVFPSGMTIKMLPLKRSIGQIILKK